MFEDINEFFVEKKIPKFRFKQLEDAVFKQVVSSFDEITVYPKWMRDELKEKFSISSMFLVESHLSGDTLKFVLKTHDNNFVECVLMIHTDGRRTVCVSCQVFCAVGCKFCATGANQFKRSLTTTEIVEQVLFVSRYLKHNGEFVTNVVFMGMGEPFLNFDAVISSIRILNDKDKLNIGARHITVSTSGFPDKIRSFADFELQCRMAISLHAPNEKLRSELMPINKKYSLSEVMAACDYFTAKTNKRVSYEYVLIKGVNNSPENAKELVNLLKNRLAHVNLLVYNPHEFATYERPDQKSVIEFKKILDENGIENSIRRSMGDDISGACGQLAGKTQN